MTCRPTRPCALESKASGTVPEAFDSRSHGLVGLHVMHRYL